jgi:hypothetical protein
MDHKTRRKLGLFLAATGVTLLTAGLALAGWIVVASAATSAIAVGLAIAYPQSVPSRLITKNWARKENRRIIEDPDNEFHRWYMAGTKGFPEVPKFKFGEAKRYLDKLQRIQLRRPLWRRFRMTRNLGAAIVVGMSLIVAAILFGGIYDSRASGDGIFLWRTNKFTGAITICMAKSATANPVCYDAKRN